MNKHILNTFLTLVILSIPIWVIWHNIFPTINVRSNLNDFNPYGKNIILLKKINNKNYLIFNHKELYKFDQIDLELLLKNKPEIQTSIQLEKGYESMLYPLGGVITQQNALQEKIYIDNNSSILNGSLVADEQSAYLISRGKYLPIASEIEFIKLGFLWENIKPIENTELAKLEEGEKLYNYHPHPDGTILKTKNGKFFMVFEEKRWLIQEEELLSHVWPDYNWVDIENDLILLEGNCQINLKKKKTTCAYKDRPDIFGSTYMFDLGNLKGEEIKNIKISLHTDFRKDREQSLRMFLSKIKEEIIKRINFQTSK